ncbi:hypothetical protein GT044_31275, partial [Streptomyces sp. SID335]|nr:hypothetical protein [Streptomyces sp. SID335]
MGGTGVAGRRRARRRAPQKKPRALAHPDGENDQVRYRILGATEAYDDQGAPLSVGGQRLRALLAALALQANRTATVGTLIEEVWAGDPPADAPAALQALVGRLRRAVGKDAVVSAPGGYRLAVAPDDVDLHRFERLAREGRA